MKTFKEFMKESPEEPKARGEKAFKDLHTDNIDKKDHPAKSEASFKASTYRVKRKADREDLDPKQE